MGPAVGNCAVDKTEMHQILPGSAYLRAKAFSFSHFNPPVGRLGVHKELGRDWIAGIADPS